MEESNNQQPQLNNNKAQTVSGQAAHANSKPRLNRSQRASLDAEADIAVATPIPHRASVDQLVAASSGLQPLLDELKMLDTECRAQPIKRSPDQRIEQRNYRILLVDDDSLDRQLVSRLIEKSERQVVISEAGTIKEANQFLASVGVDAILLDYRLPDGKGTANISHFRDLVNNPYLPVIVLTGCGDEQTALESFHDGASDYIPKNDMSTAALFRALDNALEKAELHNHIDSQREKMFEANLLLKKQNREINSFYQTVSHELKTPLTAAREYAALVMDGVAGEVNEQQQELLACSIECCDALKILVDDLLDTAEYENGNVQVVIERADPQQCIETAVDRLRRNAQYNHAVIETYYAEALPTVDMDQTRIAQLVSNLIGNAIKFAGDRPLIKLEVRHNPDTQALDVMVSDNGPGIAPSKQAKIFEKFYQAGHSPLRGQSGMGLGLYLCKKIVQSHCGNITLLKSDSTGSVFKFSLPLIQRSSHCIGWQLCREAKHC